MTNPALFEEVVHRLAYAIDPDRPPGIAARNLARAAVALVHDRSGAQAVALEQALNRLAMSARFARFGQAPCCPMYGIDDEPEPPTEPDGGRRLSSPHPEAPSGGPEVSTRPPMLLGPEGPVREAPPGGPVPEGHERGVWVHGEQAKAFEAWRDSDAEGSSDPAYRNHPEFDPFRAVCSVCGQRSHHWAATMPDDDEWICYPCYQKRRDQQAAFERDVDALQPEGIEPAWLTEGKRASRRVVCDFLSEQGECDGESAACEGCPKRGAQVTR